MKNIRIFYLKIFIFWVVKFSVYLNRHVFEMHSDYLKTGFLDQIKAYTENVTLSLFFFFC